MKNTLIVLASGIIVALAAGCSESPKESYKEAAEALKEAREARAEAQEDLEEKKQALAEIKKEREQAEQELEQARERLQEAEAGIDKSVSDEVLFRLVQSTMLNADQFSGSAISVSVRERVVLLTGTVPDEQTKQAAIKAAGDHPGVREVRSELKIISNKDQQKTSDA